MALGRLRGCSLSPCRTCLAFGKKQAHSLVLRIVELQRGCEGGRTGRTELWTRVAAPQRSGGRMAEPPRNGGTREQGCGVATAKRRTKKKKKKASEKKRGKKAPRSPKKPPKGCFFSERHCGGLRSFPRAVKGSRVSLALGAVWGGPFAWRGGGT